MNLFKCPVITAAAAAAAASKVLPVTSFSSPNVFQPSSISSNHKKKTLAVTSITPPSTKRGPNKEKKPRDPFAPKKPLTAFLLFCMEERSKVMVTNGTSRMRFAEAGKELGRRWALLDKEAKTVLKDKEKLAWIEYEKAMSSYKSRDKFLKKVDHEQNSVSKKTSQEPVLSLALKKPFNCEAEDMEDYFTFVAQNWRGTAASNPGVTGQEVQILLMERWGNRMPAENKSTKRQKRETMPSDGGAGIVGKSSSGQKRLAVEQEVELNRRKMKQVLWAKWQAMGEEERCKFQAAINRFQV